MCLGYPLFLLLNIGKSGDPDKDGNVGISINLYQDSIIQYATSLSNLIAPSITWSNKIKIPATGDLNITNSNGSSLAIFTNTGVTIGTQLNAFNNILANSIYCNYLGASVNLTIDNNVSTMCYLRADVYNKTEITTNYYNKTTSDANYYTKTYINSNYYTNTAIDSLINLPARLHYAGFIASTGVINRDNGFYSFSVNKTGTGVYQILFNTESISVLK